MLVLLGPVLQNAETKKLKAHKSKGINIKSRSLKKKLDTAKAYCSKEIYQENSHKKVRNFENK